MAKRLIEYAISFGLEEREGLWKIEFPHPIYPQTKQAAYLPLDIEDARIGDVIDGIKVAEPGIRLNEIMEHLNKRIESFPYYWPWQNTYVDKYSYDFEVDMDIVNDMVNSVEMGAIAYEIAKEEVAVKPAPETERVIETEILEPGGAMVKLTITMNEQQPVNQITLNPFVQYPMEVASIMYEEDTETFHPKKELILNQDGKKLFLKEENSTNAVVLNFPTIIAKRITIILRQKNYRKNKYLIRESEVHKQDLWKKISQREAEVTLDVTDGLDTVEEENISKWTEWDIYMQAYNKYKKELEAWKQRAKEYKEGIAAREAAIRKAERRFAEAEAEYRAEYNKAERAFQKAFDDYEDRYDRKRSEYLDKLDKWKKNEAAIREWERTWG